MTGCDGSGPRSSMAAPKVTVPGGSASYLRVCGGAAPLAAGGRQLRATQAAPRWAVQGRPGTEPAAASAPELPQVAVNKGALRAVCLRQQQVRAVHRSLRGLTAGVRAALCERAWRPRRNIRVPRSDSHSGTWQKPSEPPRPWNGSAAFSKTDTAAPSLCNTVAAARPPMEPPTTATFNIDAESVLRSRSRRDSR